MVLILSMSVCLSAAAWLALFRTALRSNRLHARTHSILDSDSFIVGAEAANILLLLTIFLLTILLKASFTNRR